MEPNLSSDDSDFINEKIEVSPMLSVVAGTSQLELLASREKCLKERLDALLKCVTVFTEALEYYKDKESKIGEGLKNCIEVQEDILGEHLDEPNIEPDRDENINKLQALSDDLSKENVEHCRFFQNKPQENSETDSGTTSKSLLNFDRSANIEELYLDNHHLGIDLTIKMLELDTNVEPWKRENEQLRGNLQSDVKDLFKPTLSIQRDNETEEFIKSYQEWLQSYCGALNCSHAASGSPECHVQGKSVTEDSPTAEGFAQL